MLNNSRGLSTFDAILGLGALIVVMVALLTWLSSQGEKATAKLTASNLDRIGESVETYLFREYENVLQAANAAGGITEIPINSIMDVNAEGDLFSTHSPYKQPFKIYASYINANTIDVLITTDQSSSNDVPIQVRSLIAHYSKKGAGYIENTSLIATGLVQDISKFQTANNIPNNGDVAAYKVIRRNVLYGDVLYRRAIPGFADANRMDTHLDMNGFDITDVDALSSERLNVSEEATIRGGLEVFDDFNVVGTSTFDGDVTTQDINSSGIISTPLLETGSASVSGTINAGSLNANILESQTLITDSLESQQTTGSTLNAGDLSTDSLSTDTLVSNEITTNRTRTNELRGSTAYINDLTTGNCVGC